MKIQLFDKNLIRTYMISSSALDAGIEYVMYINRSASEEVAKETAIIMAQEWCHERWLRDSSVYTSERSVFGEFERAVRDKEYFYEKGMTTRADRAQKAAEQEQLWAEEAARVQNLKDYCTEHGLDFKKENKKAIAKLKFRYVIGILLFLLGCAGGGFFLLRAMMVDRNGFPELGIAIGIFLLCTILGMRISPKIPENYFSMVEK